MTSLEEQWDASCALLAQFYVEHGTWPTPRTDIKLCNWVQQQRKQRKKNKLSDERIKKLDGIGFLWEVRRRQWQERNQASVPRPPKGPTGVAVTKVSTGPQLEQANATPASTESISLSERKKISESLGNQRPTKEQASSPPPSHTTQDQKCDSKTTVGQAAESKNVHKRALLAIQTPTKKMKKTGLPIEEDRIVTEDFEVIHGYSEVQKFQDLYAQDGDNFVRPYGSSHDTDTRSYNGDSTGIDEFEVISADQAEEQLEGYPAPLQRYKVYTDDSTSFDASTWWHVDLSQKMTSGATLLLVRCMREYAWDKGFAMRVLRGYRQFLELVKNLEDWDVLLLAPSIPVHQMWTQHILDTSNYHGDCHIICDHAIQYDPDGYSHVDVLADRMNSTVFALKANFGRNVDESVWHFGQDGGLNAFYQRGQKRVNEGDTTTQQLHIASNVSGEITVWVRNQTVKEKSFKMERNMRFHKLFDSYAEFIGYSSISLEFLFNGMNIEPNATPAMLGMQDEDRIDSVIHLF